jgi:2-polyprenyl-6-methoxyphenol hydroxylase-like FAD-dependent oxidoreductase
MAERFVELGGTLKEGERVPAEVTKNEGLVIATGRPAKKGSQRLGLKTHLIDFELQTDLEMHLGDGGYLGMSKIEDRKVNACGLFKLRPEVKASKSSTMQEYLSAIGLESLAERVAAAEKDPTSQMGVSAFILGEQKHENRSLVRLGDQEAIIAPLSGNGMSMAFESSAQVVPLIEAYLDSKLRWDEVGDLLNHQLGRRFRRRIRVANFLNPMLTSRPMQRGIAKMNQLSLLPFKSLYQATRL